MGLEDRGVVWTPSEEMINDSNLMAFVKYLGLNSVEELNERAFCDPGWFNHELLKYINYKFSTPYYQVLDLSAGLERPRWCVGGKTNVVLNCIDIKRSTDIYTKAALHWVSETGERKTFTYQELDLEVSKLAWGLRSLELSVGDVIAVYLPNLAESVVAMLAIAKIGGILLPIFSGLGIQALAQRLADSHAQAIITVNGSLRRGRIINSKKIVDEALQSCPHVKYVIVSNYISTSHNWIKGRDYWWDDLISDAPNDYLSVETEYLEADAPFLLIYTSGTSGKPKGVIHTHCGFPVKAVLDLSICMDLKHSDTFFWMSDMGWLVGPLLVFGGMLVGAKIILVEGAPNYPSKDRILKIIKDYEVSFLGLSPTLARLLMQLGEDIIEGYCLDKLRIIVSTGEVWTPDAWDWVFNRLGRSKVPLLNYSGGTEVGGILTGTIIHPLKPCSFAIPIPGTGADIVDSYGFSIKNRPGQKGELVMRVPSIGLTRGLWNDSKAYKESYWSRYPGVWSHGDSVSRDADGMWYVHGRTDDVITLSGKRTDPSEIEAVVNTIKGIKECAVVGVPDSLKGMCVACFCVLEKGALSKKVREEVKRKVESSLGKSYLPKEVVFLTQLPRTRNQKIIRGLIRKAWLGEEIQDTGNLVNVEIIEEIRSLRKIYS